VPRRKSFGPTTEKRLVDGVEWIHEQGSLGDMRTKAAVLEGDLWRPAVHKRLRIRRILAQKLHVCQGAGVLTTLQAVRQPA
jgi:hypothetical protein